MGVAVAEVAAVYVWYGLRCSIGNDCCSMLGVEEEEEEDNDDDDFFRRQRTEVTQGLEEKRGLECSDQKKSSWGGGRMGCFDQPKQRWR